MGDLWKKAREEESLPEPPNGISESRWAMLVCDAKGKCQVGRLFSESTSFGAHERSLWQSCGVAKVSVEEVDWMVQRRVCGPCKSAK